MDIPQSGRLAVDIVFAVTAAVIPAGDHHFIGFIGKSTIRIIQCQGSFRKAHCTALLGAAENHIFHLGAAEGLGALLTHDPQKGIGNIGFTGAVGANNGSDITVKAHQRFIGEGLEALDFQRF